MYFYTFSALKGKEEHITKIKIEYVITQARAIFRKSLPREIMLNSREFTLIIEVSLLVAVVVLVSVAKVSA